MGGSKIKGTLGNTKIMGLTGGIASGKSSVAACFKKLGIPVLDADRLAKDLLSNDTELQGQVKRALGTLDRVKLREMIFNDPAQKKKLESILHPAIRSHSRAFFEKIKKDSPDCPLIIYEAALLIETERHLDFDGLILVLSPLKERLERLQKRDQITPELAQRMIDAQMPDDEKRKHATYIIDNYGDLERLEEATQALLARIQNQAQQS